MLVTVNRNPSPAVLRQFGWVMLIGLGVIAALIWWKLSPDWQRWSSAPGQAAACILAAIGLVICVVSRAAPVAVKPIYVGWMTVGMRLGAVMTPVLLTVLFLVVLPVFALLRFKDPLRLKLKAAGSYWEPHKPHPHTLERCARPF